MIFEYFARRVYDTLLQLFTILRIRCVRWTAATQYRSGSVGVSQPRTCDRRPGIHNISFYFTIRITSTSPCLGRDELDRKEWRSAGDSLRFDSIGPKVAVRAACKPLSSWPKTLAMRTLNLPESRKFCARVLSTCFLVKINRQTS